jgi:histidinol-phosphatase (PHP family)
MILDYHMHLVDDDDPYTDDILSLDRVGEYVTAAERAGVAEIGFTDHVFRFTVARDWLDHPLWTADGINDLDRYVGCIAAARDAGMPVKIGLEVDYLAGREEAIREALAGYDWDFLLGSVHWLDGLAVDWDAAPIWDRYAVADVWEMYVDALCAAAATGIYDSMAHPDLAKSLGYRPDPKPFRLYERIADAFQASGACAEVSTGGFDSDMGEIYPDPELLAMLCERGVPVTLGSDAHGPGEVGRLFDEALAVLRDAGYRTITRFDRREPVQVEIE